MSHCEPGRDTDMVLPTKLSDPQGEVMGQRYPSPTLTSFMV